MEFENTSKAKVEKLPISKEKREYVFSRRFVDFELADSSIRGGTLIKANKQDGNGNNYQLPKNANRTLVLIERSTSETRGRHNDPALKTSDEGIMYREMMAIGQFGDIDSWEAIAVQREDGNFEVIDHEYREDEVKFEYGSESSIPYKVSDYFLPGEVIDKDRIKPKGGVKLGYKDKKTGSIHEEPEE